MNLQKKGFLLILFVGLFLILLMGSSSVIAREKPLITFSMFTLDHPYCVTLVNDLEHWAKEANMDFIWADGNADAANQIADCEDLIAKKPDVFIVNPLHFEALAVVYDMCTKAQIPLMVIGRAINVKPGTGVYFTLIMGDNVDEGRKSGELIAQALHEKYGEYKGNVIEIQAVTGASVTVDRNAGFREVIDKYPNIKVIASQNAESTGGYREPAMKLMEDWLQVFPKGQIDAVYCHNDEMALGAASAIKAAGRDEILGYVVGIDGGVNALKAVLDGDLLASVQSSPYFGEISIASAQKYLQGGTVPTIQWVPFKAFHTMTKEAQEMTKKYYDNLVANNLFY